MVENVVPYYKSLGITQIVGISRGGVIPAVMLSHQLNIPVTFIYAKSYKDKKQGELKVWGYDKAYEDALLFQRMEQILFVDDIYDSGATWMKVVEDFKNQTKKDFTPHFFTLVDKALSPRPNFLGSDYVEKEVWVHFPWENNELR